jgi:hypothetical protein
VYDIESDGNAMHYAISEKSIETIGTLLLKEELYANGFVGVSRIKSRILFREEHLEFVQQTEKFRGFFFKKISLKFPHHCY